MEPTESLVLNMLGQIKSTQNANSGCFDFNLQVDRVPCSPEITEAWQLQKKKKEEGFQQVCLATKGSLASRHLGWQWVIKIMSYQIFYNHNICRRLTFLHRVIKFKQKDKLKQSSKIKVAPFRA